MDIQRGLELHMERARRNGSSPEGAERCGILYLTILIRTLENKLAVKQAEEIRDALPVLAGKAVTDADRLEVLDLSLGLARIHLEIAQQVALLPEHRRAVADLEGKAVVAGMAREKRRALRRLIEDIGGSAADGGYATDLLDFEPHHVERAMMLTRGEAEPDSETETKALARYREKIGESP